MTEVYVPRRFIGPRELAYARHADRILRQHDAVYGTTMLANRSQARYRAQRLIRLMVELTIRERWELSEHVERRGARWAWGVILLPRSGQ